MGLNSVQYSKGKMSSKGNPVYPLENAAVDLKNPRRIVKGAPPKRGAAVEEISTTVHDNDSDEVRGVEMKWESPSVARENIQEKAASTNQERKMTAQELRTTKRNKGLMERRRITSPSAKPKATAPETNPMSRFFSAFYLNSHPEHKRRVGPTISTEEDDPKKPVEKRLRPSMGNEKDMCMCNGKSNTEANDKVNASTISPPAKRDDSVWNPSTMVVVAGTVAMVAIVVTLVLRAKKAF